MADPAGRIDVSVDASVEFEADLVADLGGLNVPVDNPALQPRIEFAWPHAISSDPQLGFNFDTLQPPSISNFSELVRIKEITVEDITELLRRLVDLVERISGEDLMNRRLPLLNTSIGEALDTVDYVAELVDQVTTDPAATLKTLEAELESALGLLDDQLTLSYDETLHALRLDVNLEVSQDSPQVVPLNLDLSAAGLPGLETLVDFQGQGTVTLDAGATLDLAIGLDPDELESTDFDDAVLIYDTTAVEATAEIRGENLAFTTAVRPLGVDVGPGTVVLDRDGLFGSVSDAPAVLGVAMQSQPGGAKPLSAVTADDFELIFNARAGVDLPLEFNLGSPTTQPLQVHWVDLDSFSFTQVDTIAPDGGNQVVLPELEQAIGDFDLGDGLYALAAGVEGLFGLIDDYLGDEVFGIPIPIIGSGLTNAVEFLDDLRSRVGSTFDIQGIAADAARQALFDALGPGSGLNGGAGIIVDRANTSGQPIPDGQITVEDIGLVATADEVVFRLQLGQAAIAAETSVALDVGIPGLDLQVDGDLATTVGYTIDVGIGLNSTEGAFVEFYGGDEISLEFDASVDDLLGEGRIGPLSISARTLDADELTADQRLASRLDPNDATTETINAIQGAYQIDLGEGRFSLAGLSGLSGLGIETEAVLVGSLNLQIETSVGGADAGLPSLRADVNVNWDRREGALGDVVAGLARPSIELSNVGLDLGSFVSDVVAPVLEPVNEFLEPFRPILDALTTPIPVLSDIAGSVTFTDIIGALGEGAETVSFFVDAVADLARLIDIPIVNGDVFLPLGNFSTTYNADGTLSASSEGGAFGGAGDFDSFLASLENAPLREYLQSMPRTSASGGVSSEPGKFNLPILTNPTSAVGLLLGQDVDSITYTVPRLEATFSYSQYIPIWPIFGITVGGSMSAVADFAFGYDTAGIRQFAQSRRPEDLLDGFYLADERVDENGNVEDVAELAFRLGLTAGGELNLLAVKAGVEGGIFAGIDLNLNDPNNDGKVRFDELASNLALGRHPLLGPLWIFDASGKLEAGVSIYASAVGFRGELNIGPFTILDFDIPRPEPATPELAHLEDGTLIVHVDPHSAVRAEGDLADGDDDIILSWDDENNQTIVSGFGRNQPFSGVERIFIDSGLGNDKIVVDAALLVPVEIRGGSGNDEIRAGGGAAFIDAGAGDDIVVGSTRADTIIGGLGNDQLDGGDGDDFIQGGDGDDQIRGSRGADRLHGDGGRDTVSGGDGSDQLYGGDGDDILSGDEGDDLLWGEAQDGSGAGRDFLQGGPGADRLFGGASADELFGGTGPDELYGEGGNDLLVGGTAVRDNDHFSNPQAAFDTAAQLLVGGEGNDVIYGTAGIDTVVDMFGVNRVTTYESDDTITVGPGDDEVDSGSGDDHVDVGGGDNRVFAGSGFDIVVAGIGDDWIDLRARQNTT